MMLWTLWAVVPGAARSNPLDISLLFSTVA